MSASGNASSVAHSEAITCVHCKTQGQRVGIVVSEFGMVAWYGPPGWFVRHLQEPRAREYVCGRCRKKDPDPGLLEVAAHGQTPSDTTKERGA